MLFPHVFANDLNTSLKQTYGGKVFIIRNFWHGDHLQYDSAGQLMGDGDVGYWTTDGLVRIENVSVVGSTLHLECKRMVVSAGSRGLEYKESRSKDKKREIDIQYGATPVTPDGIDSALKKVFVSEKEDFLESVPPYWKKCITAALSATQAEQQSACHFSPQLQSLLSTASLSTAPAPTQRKAEPEGVLKIGAGMTPPKASWAPDPHYGDEALAAHHQGTCVLTLIVNSSGSPKHIEISRPAGYGLDEQAVLTVQNWQFAPATKDGKPVSVFATVEISFHL